MSSAGFLLLCAVSLAASPMPTAAVAVPPFQPKCGDEWTYRGTVTETGSNLKRRHDLEVRAFVLDRTSLYADVAVLTLLRREDDVVSAAVPAVTGQSRDRSSTPSAARLDLVRLSLDGSARLLAPPGKLPLALNGRTPTTSLPVPSGFDHFEFGLFFPRPKGVLEPGRAWPSPDPDGNRPRQKWVAKTEDFVAGERCLPVVLDQQTKPTGHEMQWGRTETVWLSTLDGSVRRVHRLIRTSRLRPPGQPPIVSKATEVKYELQDRTYVLGQEYGRSRRDIEMAYAFGADLNALLPNAAKWGPKPFEARLARLDDYLRETPADSSYREAVRAVRRRLEAARKGEAVPVGADGTASPIEPAGDRKIGSP